MNNESMHAGLDPRQLDREERLLSAVRDTVVLRRDSLRLQVPVDLERSIRMALADERNVPAKESWLQRAIDWIRQPAVSFGMAAATLALIVGLAVLGQRSDALPRELTHAALTAFPGVHSGSTTLDITSSDKQQISAYLASHGIQHAVFYPEVDAELAGANVFSVNGLPCAELVYKKANHTIALLQVDAASISAKRVEMDPIVAEDVAYSKWHWASTPGNGTLFVWESNSIMCTVVSDLQIDEVSSLFKLEAL